MKLLLNEIEIFVLDNPDHQNSDKYNRFFYHDQELTNYYLFETLVNLYEFSSICTGGFKSKECTIKD